MIEFAIATLFEGSLEDLFTCLLKGRVVSL